MPQLRAECHFIAHLHRPCLRLLFGSAGGVAAWLLRACLAVACCLIQPVAGAELGGAGSGLEPQLVEGDILVVPSSNRRSIALPRTSRLWNDGIVPYLIDPALSPASIAAVEAAVDHWNSVSGITLRSLDDWPDDASLPVDSIRFQPGSGCASWVGRRGGEQEVWVAPNCTAGSVMHEIGHALGLEHEHTRPDRDQYITIHWENIDPEKRHNFDVAPAGSRMLGDYDYESIMHYGPNNFSLAGKATISPRFGTVSMLGQRLAPSRGDLSAIAELYASDLSVVTRIYSDERRSEVNVHVSNESAQGAHQIEVRLNFVERRLLAYSDQDWQCSFPAAGQASCKLARLAGLSGHVLVLEFAGALRSDELSASVHSKTPDGNPSNNADASDTLPVLAAATAFEDPAEIVLSSASYGGQALWLTPSLLLLLLQRQTGGRVYRQTGHRIERLGCRIFRRYLLL